MASLNQRALVSSANFAPLSEVKGVPPSAGSVIYAVLAPKLLTKSLTARLELKHYVVLITFAATRRSKHHCALKSEATTSSLPALSSAKLHLGAELNDYLRKAKLMSWVLF